jgi:hypothetical protein
MKHNHTPSNHLGPSAGHDRGGSKERKKERKKESKERKKTKRGEKREPIDGGMQTGTNQTTGNPAMEGIGTRGKKSQREERKKQKKRPTGLWRTRI